MGFSLLNSNATILYILMIIGILNISIKQSVLKFHHDGRSGLSLLVCVV